VYRTVLLLIREISVMAIYCGERRGVHRALVRKPEGMRPLGRRSC